ncbi:MAG: hypothetical protein U9N81_13995 [Bacillota bacterium]|nr:hypothetical protein [Bacillota bacterium]
MLKKLVRVEVVTGLTLETMSMAVVVLFYLAHVSCSDENEKDRPMK